MINLALIYVTLLFTNLCTVIFYKKLTDKSIRNYKLLFISIPIITIISSLNAFTPNVLVKSLITLSLEFTTIFINFEESIKCKAIVSVIIWIFNIIFDFLISIGVAHLLTNNYMNFLTSYKLQMVALTFVLMVMIYIFFSIPIINKCLKNIISTLSTVKFLYIYIGISLVFYLSITTINVLYFSVNNSQLLLFFIIATFLAMVIALVKLLLKYEILFNTNNQLIETNSSFSIAISEYKLFKHNHRERLMAIRNVGNKKVKELVDIQLEETESDISFVEGTEDLPDSVKGIVWQKLSKIKFSKANIKLINNLRTDEIKNVSMKKYNDLCLALGICLENALEAALETSKPEIILEFTKKDNKIYIILYNNFINNIDVDRFGEKEYSTKNRSSGYGIYSLKKLRNIVIKNKVYNNLFETIITI